MKAIRCKTSLLAMALFAWVLVVCHASTTSDPKIQQQAPRDDGTARATTAPEPPTFKQPPVPTPTLPSTPTTVTPSPSSPPPTPTRSQISRISSPAPTPSPSSPPSYSTPIPTPPVASPKAETTASEYSINTTTSVPKASTDTPTNEPDHTPEANTTNVDPASTTSHQDSSSSSVPLVITLLAVATIALFAVIAVIVRTVQKRRQATASKESIELPTLETHDVDSTPSTQYVCQRPVPRSSVASSYRSAQSQDHWDTSSELSFQEDRGRSTCGSFSPDEEDLDLQQLMMTRLDRVSSRLRPSYSSRKDSDASLGAPPGEGVEFQQTLYGEPGQRGQVVVDTTTTRPGPQDDSLKTILEHH